MFDIGEDIHHLLIIFLASFLVLFIVRRVSLKSLMRSKILKGHEVVQRFIIRLIRRFVWPFYGLLAAYILSSLLITEPAIKSIADKILIVCTTFIGVYIFQVVIGFLLELVVVRSKHDHPNVLNTINFSKILLNVLIWACGVVLILSNLGYNINSLIAGLGIGGIAIALAVQNILGDILNSFSIIFDKPFQIGDAITVGAESGTVEYIGLKTTRIRSVNGEQLIIPNTDLVKSRIQNFHEMKRRRAVISIAMAYSSTADQLRLGKKLIENTLLSLNQVTCDRVHISNFSDYSVVMEVVFYVESADYKTFMDKKEQILLEIRDVFQKNHLAFALPTRTVINGTVTSETIS